MLRLAQEGLPPGSGNLPVTELQTERGMVRVPPGIWKVDPAHSSVGFKVKQMMIATVRGHLREFDGGIEASQEGPEQSARRWRSRSTSRPCARYGRPPSGLTPAAPRRAAPWR